MIRVGTILFSLMLARVSCAQGPSTFGGTIVLGRPEPSSIQLNILDPTQGGTVAVEYGTLSNNYLHATANDTLVAGVPLVVTLDGLDPNTQYFYRLIFQPTGGTASTTVEYRFHTPRPAGTGFTFTIQADSHLDNESDPDLYHRTLANVLADNPDFHIDLGDTFMCEKFSAPLTGTVQPASDWATVNARYLYERSHFGLFTHSVPLFLVNGNHEGEAGWLNDGTSNNLAVWATRARQLYFLNPTPDDFYSGDATVYPLVGKRAAWYSWQWGNALFVVLDPFWNSPKQPGSDGWNITLGATQYQWLQQTLAASTAIFKFVFIHNLVGGLDGQMRGGIEAAPYFESGGANADGSAGFLTKRPGWAMPVHALLAQHGVTALFHGHDHLYARQQLDGVIYQEAPQPSALNSNSGPNLASAYHYASGTILSSSGHLRVTVGPHHVTSQYVRAWLPANETALEKNGQVDDTWTIAQEGWPVASFTCSPAAPLAGQAITFTDTSSGSPAAWLWDFGDGSTSTNRNPVHTFTTAGSFTVNLTVTNPAGSHATSAVLTVAPTAVIPSTSFAFTPASPLVGQTVAFTDTSAGTPTAWAWNFGDGGKSSLQNPTHAYAVAGTFTVSLKASNAAGTKTAKHTVTITTPQTTDSFAGNIVLGCPTFTSIKANVFSPDQGGSIYLEYGSAHGSYPYQTTTRTLVAATPLEITIDGLTADTQYYYRLNYQSAGASGFVPTSEYGFHTARPAGSTFTFCIQGDSHPERVNTQFNGDLYSRTLLTAAADQPDFYLTIGDDFSADTLDPATVTAAQVTERYTIQRPYLGLIGCNTPVFLVNGNHEQAARYLLDGTGDNVAVWAQNARNAHYPQPAPDSFYSGNTEVVPYIGLLRNRFAWTWGDALFVVIDPYWASAVCVDDPFDGGPKRTNLWDITHGDAQYQWLKTTLEQSQAKYKFVFAHHVLGTGRGGIEEAGLYEWGGYNSNGTTWGFTANRPTWATPIHQLMAANHVTIFFQGHDHIWVRQQLDGVIYQTLPEPADPNYSLFNADAYLTGDKYPNTGYTRVTVSPANVQVEYVRTYLPADEGTGRVNGAVAFGYSVSPTEIFVDSVGDGIPDWWRARFFGGDGRTSGVLSAATADPDHDGQDNLHEYLGGTDPGDPTSFFVIRNVVAGNGLTFRFQSAANRRYTLYTTDDLTTGTWTSIPSQVDIPGSGGIDSLSDPAPSGARRFYRIGVKCP